MSTLDRYYVPQKVCNALQTTEEYSLTTFIQKYKNERRYYL